MNIDDMLEQYILNEGNTRQVGKTTAMAEAAKKIGATVITATEQQAQMYKKKFGVETKFLGQNIIGSNKPIIFDHYALYTLFKEICYPSGMSKDSEIDDLKNALEYTINDYRSKKFRKKKWKIKEHERMVRRWGLKIES